MAKKQHEEKWRDYINVDYSNDEVREINQGLPNAYIPFKVSWMEEFFQDMTPDEIGKVVLALYEFWETGEKPKLESRELRFVVNPMTSYLAAMLESKFKIACENGKKAALIREIRKLKEQGVPDSEIMEKYPEYQPPNATSRHVTPRYNNQLSKSKAISNNQKSKAITTVTSNKQEAITTTTTTTEGVSDSEGDTSPSSTNGKINYSFEIMQLWKGVFGFEGTENTMLGNRIGQFGEKATYETLKEILREPIRSREEVQTELYTRLLERQTEKVTAS